MVDEKMCASEPNITEMNVSNRCSVVGVEIQRGKNAQELVTRIGKMAKKQTQKKHTERPTFTCATTRLRIVS